MKSECDECYVSARCFDSYSQLTIPKKLPQITAKRTKTNDAELSVFVQKY